MAISIETPPNDYAFLGNPIPVVLKETAVNFRRFLYKVTVAGEDSESYEAMRNLSNEAEIDISALLMKFFDIANYELPDLTDTDIQLLNKQTSVIKAYTLTASSQFTSGADSTITDSAYVVWGALSYRAKKTDTMLQGSTANTYPILANNFNKRTTPTGKEFATFANIFLANANVPSAFVLEYTFYDAVGAEITSGTISTLTRILVGKTSLFDLSYAKIVAPLTSELVYSYRLRLRATFSATPYYSPYITFTVDRDYKPQVSEFLYINSRGGLSTIRLFGEREDMHELTRENTMRYLAPSANLPTSDKYSRINSEMEGFKIATGYYENWDNFAQVLDFFRSQGVWEIVGEELIPVELITKKIQTRSTNRIELASEVLEFKYLMSNYD
jgi:hypothetical protein